MKKGIIERYTKFFPQIDMASVVSMGEGDTPLIYAPKLAREIGCRANLWLKCEGYNPTGSFKDRGMTTAVSWSMQTGGVEALACASTGNTAASAAGYGAVAEVPTFVLVPLGGIAEGKLAQIRAYGARVVEVRGSFDDCQDIIRKIEKECPGVAILNNTHPYRLAGQRTAAFEIWEELQCAPDYHIIPVGNAGNITAYWMGYKEYGDYLKAQEALRLKEEWGSYMHEDIFLEHLEEFFEDSVIERHFKLPKMMGYQAEGAAPIVRGHVVENPKTIASAINIGNPARWREALEAVTESQGQFGMVSEEEIKRFHEVIPKLHPGAFCEPSSAVSVAGLAKAISLGEIENTPDTTIVCTLTGAGWKDFTSFSGIAGARRRRKEVAEASFKEVAKLLGL